LPDSLSVMSIENQLASLLATAAKSLPGLSCVALSALELSVLRWAG